MQRRFLNCQSCYGWQKSWIVVCSLTFKCSEGTTLVYWQFYELVFYSFFSWKNIFPYDTHGYLVDWFVEGLWNRELRRAHYLWHANQIRFYLSIYHKHHDCHCTCMKRVLFLIFQGRFARVLQNLQTTWRIYWAELKHVSTALWL